MDHAARGPSGKGGRATLPGVLLAATGLVLSIGVAPPPVRAVEAPAPVVLDHLSFRRGRFAIEIPRVEARGTSVTAAELRDILDPSSPLDLGQRFTRLSAGTIVAPEVTIRKDTASGDGKAETVTLHDLLLADVEGGKVGALSIRAVDAAVRTGGDERDAIAAGAITAHGVDLQLARQIATESRSDRDRPVSPVFGDFAVDGVRLTNAKGQDLRFDRLESGALEGRPFLVRPADLLRRLEESPDALQPFPTNPLFAPLVDAAISFRLDRLRLSGAAFEGTRGDGFRIGTLLLNVLGSPGLPLFEIDGLGFDAEGVHLSMKSAVLSGSDKGGLFAMAAARLAGTPLPTPAAPPAPDATGGVAVEVSDIHMAIPTTGDDGPFPPGTVNVVDLPRTAFGESAAAGGASAEVHSQMEVRYTIPPAGGDVTIQNLRDLGLSPLDATFGYRVTYDIPGHAMRLDELAFSAKDVGSVTLAGGLADMPDAPLAQGLTSDQQVARFGAATLRDVTATLVDQGFLARALRLLARQGGTSPAMMKAGLKTKIDLALPDLMGVTPAEAAVARAVDAFIDGGGTLVLSARAPGGLTLKDAADAGDPAALARRLEVVAEAHP